MSKKFTKFNPSSYCEILQYIKQNHEYFYQLVDAACLTGLLRSSNLTVLIPDEKILDDIAKTWEEKDTLNKVHAFVIKQYVPSLEAFSGISLPNANFQDIKDQIKSANNKEVILENKSKITNLDSSQAFVYRSRENRDKKIAVYKISGYVGIDSPEYIQPKRFQRGKRGGMNHDYDDIIYSGGNDTELAELHKSENKDSRLGWEELKFLTSIRSGNSIDHLSHLTMSYLLHLDTANPALSELLKKFHPCSPLYYLFIKDIDSKSMESWAMNKKYDKKATFSAQLKTGNNEAHRQSMYERGIKSATIIKGFTYDNIISNIKENALICIQDCKVTLESLGEYFKDMEHFRDWLIAVGDFCTLYTPHYIMALKETDADTRREKIDMILDTFYINHQRIIEAAKSPSTIEWSKMPLLIREVDPEIARMWGVAWLYSVINLYTDYMFLSMGLRDGLDSKMPDNKDECNPGFIGKRLKNTRDVVEYYNSKL